MKVAIVTYALQVGGIETFIRLLADYFREQKHDVTIIETHTEGRWSKSFSESGYQVKQIFPNSFHSRGLHAKNIARELSSFDAVILNDAPFAQAGLGMLPDSTVAFSVLHSNMTSMLRNSTANSSNWDMLSAVSPALKKCAIIYGAPTEKVTCIPNGIVVPERWPKRDVAFSADVPFRLVYLGTIDHTQKGVLHLPPILSEVIQKYPTIQFDIIGDGPELPALRERFAKLCKITPVFHGSLSNTNAMSILAQADALIMPSYFEGLPIVLLEAIAHGVVPIVSRLDGITDFVVTDGVDGLLVPIGDEHYFAEAIIALARDRTMLRAMSQKAWETAVSRFSYQVMGRAYQSLVEETIERRKTTNAKRSGSLHIELLGDFPYLPLFMVRPARKVLRLLGLMPAHKTESLLFEPTGHLR